MNKLFSLFLITSLFLFFTACSSDKKRDAEKSVVDQIVEESPYYDSSMSRTKEDTTAIIDLATKYLNLVKENKYDDALNLLYNVDSIGIQPIDDNRKKVIINNLKKYPVLSFKIDEFRLYTDIESELRYTYEFMPKPEGNANIPNTMKGVLGLSRVRNTWYLSIPKNHADTEINDKENLKIE